MMYQITRRYSDVAARIAIAISISLFLSTTARSADVQQMDRLVQQWLDIERQAGELEADWQEQQPLLAQRIKLLQAQRDRLQAVMTSSRANRTDTEAKRAELLASQTDIEAQQNSVESQVNRLEGLARELLAQLPPPLQDTWRLELSMLTENKNTSEKLQMVLTVLSKLLEFDQRISINETQITTPDGRDVLVKQLYLGIGQAWFTNADASVSGRGWSQADGWQWVFDEKVDGNEVNTAISMFNRQQETRFVTLPVALTAELKGGAE